MSEAQLKLAGNIGREHLLSLGTCFGKFTKVRRCSLPILIFLTIFQRIINLDFMFLV
jgi:ribosome biogenesis protein Nip4